MGLSRYVDGNFLLDSRVMGPKSTTGMGRVLSVRIRSFAVRFHRQYRFVLAVLILYIDIVKKALQNRTSLKPPKHSYNLVR